MTKDELIAKQQLQIETYKEFAENNEKVASQLHGMVYGIGQPLNDNVLEMNNKQMGWAHSVYELVAQIQF